MKNSVVQLTKQAINDNKEFIVGNIAEHLMIEIENDENSFIWYLKSEEAEEINSNKNMWNKHFRDVRKMLSDNFNYNISEFKY